jgi:hypothetical protein
MRKVAIIGVMILAMAACSDDDTAGGGALFGDDVLEELGERCGDGDYFACDVLYQASEVGSQFESFGDSCGGRGVPDEAYCAWAYGLTIDLAGMRDDCSGGDMFACDTLYIYSEFGSPEEAFGDSCGGRGDPGLSCAVAYGWTP